MLSFHRLAQALLDGTILAKPIAPEQLDAREVLRRAVIRSRPILELRTKKVAGQRLTHSFVRFQTAWCVLRAEMVSFKKRKRGSVFEV
jgi:hypothetical protein